MTIDWIVLFVIVISCLAIDLGIFHKESHEVKFKEALSWSIIWITLALIFSLGIGLEHSSADAMLFLTGYVVEKSLSVDNLFLFIVIFKYFSIHPQYQHRILFWGVLGAIITRGLLIYGGVSLLHSFSWLIYVFGAIILVTGLKTLSGFKDSIDLESNVVLKLVKKVIRTKMDYVGPNFLIREGGLLYATPLLVVLIVVVFTDVLFALDSIPAILGITRDPFIVYSSNLFAILGLRALYFLLAGMMELFEYVTYGVSCILIFVGLKMLGEGLIEIPPFISLVIILSILVISILPSLPRVIRQKRDI